MAYRTLFSALFIILAAANSNAQQLQDKEVDYGIVAGFWMPGTISIEGVEADKEGSFLLRLHAFD